MTHLSQEQESKPPFKVSITQTAIRRKEREACLQPIQI